MALTKLELELLQETRDDVKSLIQKTTALEVRLDNVIQNNVEKAQREKAMMTGIASIAAVVIGKVVEWVT